MRKLHPLPVLLATFALLVLMHSSATPLFEAPDEVWHYAYARWLAEGHGLPAMDDDASGANQEVAQPPLYYGVAALFSAPFPDDDLERWLWSNPGFGHQAPGTVPDNKNMLVHTFRERWPWRGAALTVHATRMASLLFGLATVVAAWELGRETFGSRRGALLTACAVALHPQFVFMSGVISNDSAAAALCTATLWSTVRTLRRGLTPRRAAFTGALAGLAALTKTSALALLPLAGATLAWAAWRKRERAGARWAKTALIALAAFGGAALLAGGWWYGRNLALYGDPLGISSHVNTPWGREQPASLLALLPELPTLIRSFWAAYGWGHVTWPAWVYVALSLVSAIVLARSARNTWRSLQSRSRRAGTGARQVTLALATLWCGAILAALLHWMRQVEAPHGRLLFPALGAWGLLIANGLMPGAGEDGEPYAGDRGISSGARLYLLGLATLAALAPGARILATFAPPRQRAPETVLARLPDEAHTDLVYAGKVRLLGASVTPPRLKPGETLSVRACWEGLRTMDEDYTVFVHLLGPENARVAERHTYPGLGRWPTSLWEPGRTFCETYTVPVAPWATAPMRYRLSVGLFDAESGARLPASTSDGSPAEPPVVGEIVVAPAEPAPPTPQHPLDATLDGGIALVGFDAPNVAAPGERITVTLHWLAEQATPTDYAAFVHLWQPGASAPLAQDDAPPRQGWFPTSLWQAGDHVPDQHPLRIPDDLAPGTYPLWAGLYRPQDGVRATAQGIEGRYPHDLVPLMELEIR